jgi:hypothetical protein
MLAVRQAFPIEGRNDPVGLLSSAIVAAHSLCLLQYSGRLVFRHFAPSYCHAANYVDSLCCQPLKSILSIPSDGMEFVG